jgi:hypothetical protein
MAGASKQASERRRMTASLCTTTVRGRTNREQVKSAGKRERGKGTEVIVVPRKTDFEEIERAAVVPRL